MKFKELENQKLNTISIITIDFKDEHNKRMLVSWHTMIHGKYKPDGYCQGIKTEEEILKYRYKPVQIELQKKNGKTYNTYKVINLYVKYAPSLKGYLKEWYPDADRIKINK